MSRNDEKTKDLLDDLESRVKDAVAGQEPDECGEDECPGYYEIKVDAEEAILLLEALGTHRTLIVARDLGERAKQACVAVYRAVEEWRSTLKAKKPKKSKRRGAEKLTAETKES